MTNKSTDPIRVRFAPSPTGSLHIGGARTALFNWLFARQNGGTFVVRVEDTDTERSTREYEKDIFNSLQDLSIDWDEGVGKGGDYGPYRQSERMELYREYAEKLVRSGYAYYCYCTPEELEKEREECRLRGAMPQYSGRCRDLSPDKQEEMARSGIKPSLRFQVMPGQSVEFYDMIRGYLSFTSEQFGDFIILRSDGRASYNFAAVVDDTEMKITHVVRGDDHLTNTARQILLYHTLGIDVPEFAHLPLIVGTDNTKLSKRQSDTSIRWFLESGILPEALVNYIALLGWSPDDNLDILAADELVKNFSLQRVASNPAVFDMERLRVINSAHIRQMDIAALVEAVRAFLERRQVPVPDSVNNKFDDFVDVYRSEAVVLTDYEQYIDMLDGDEIILPEHSCLQEDGVADLLELCGREFSALDEVSQDSIKQLFKSLSKQSGKKGKQLYMPVRVALTGQEHGPELYNIIGLLGRENAIGRINNAVEIIRMR